MKVILPSSQFLAIISSSLLQFIAHCPRSHSTNLAVISFSLVAAVRAPGGRFGLVMKYSLWARKYFSTRGSTTYDRHHKLCNNISESQASVTVQSTAVSHLSSGKLTQSIGQTTAKLIRELPDLKFS